MRIVPHHLIDTDAVIPHDIRPKEMTQILDPPTHGKQNESQEVVLSENPMHTLQDIEDDKETRTPASSSSDTESTNSEEETHKNVMTKGIREEPKEPTLQRSTRNKTKSIRLECPSEKRMQSKYLHASKV